MNELEQATILEHLRAEVFNIEDASIARIRATIDEDIGDEYLTMSADVNGKLEFAVNKTGLSVDELKTAWTSHSASCSKCTGWSL